MTSRSLNDPPARRARRDPHPDRIGARLAGTAIMLAGALMSVARVSFSVEHRAPSAPEAETETVKMPPPDSPA